MFPKNEDSLRNLWDNIKKTNIHTAENKKEKSEERGRELTWRNNSWNSPIGERKQASRSKKHSLKQDESKEVCAKI